MSFVHERFAGALRAHIWRRVHAEDPAVLSWEWVVREGDALVELFREGLVEGSRGSALIDTSYFPSDGADALKLGYWLGARLLFAAATNQCWSCRVEQAHYRCGSCSYSWQPPCRCECRVDPVKFGLL